MKRFLIIFLIICLSSSFVFADGFTSSQASNITSELTTTGTSGTIKYYIQKIFNELYTGGSTSIRQYLINTSNSLTDSSSSNSLLKRVIDIYSLINNRTQKGNHTLMDYLSNIDSNLASGFNLDFGSISSDYPSPSSNVSPWGNAAIPFRFYLYAPDSSTLANSRVTISSSPFVPQSGADWFTLLNNNMVLGFQQVMNPSRVYNMTLHDYDTGGTFSTQPRSFADFLWYAFPNIDLGLSRLSEFFVSDDDIELKQANTDLTDEVKDNLLTPGRGSSLSVDDVRGFSAVVGGVRGFSTGSVEASDAFDVFDEDSDTWLFFSQDVLDDMNTVDYSDDSDDDSDPGRGGLRLMSSPHLQPSSYDLYLEEVFNELD